ncbi:hypothetical protein J3459_017665 [Metarhizium acridum]|nr:hypothetical protein J3459_017665 [Metarhizium acridum]
MKKATTASQPTASAGRIRGNEQRVGDRNDELAQQQQQRSMETVPSTPSITSPGRGSGDSGFSNSVTIFRAITTSCNKCSESKTRTAYGTAFGADSRPHSRSSTSIGGGGNGGNRRCSIKSTTCSIHSPTASLDITAASNCSL